MSSHVRFFLTFDGVSDVKNPRLLPWIYSSCSDDSRQSFDFHAEYPATDWLLWHSAILE